MFEPKLRVGLISTTVGAANVISDGSKLTGYNVIVNGDGALVCPPIKKGSILGITSRVSTLEKQQYVLVGPPDQTVNAAGDRFSVSMQFPQDRFNGNTHEILKFGVTAPTKVSAAADRAAIYTALYNRINAYVPNYSKAKLGFSYATKSTGARTIAAGTLLYLVGGTYVAMVVKTVVAGADGTDLTIEMCDYSGTRPSGATNYFALVSAAGTAVSKTSSAYTAAQSLVIADEAGYFPSKERLGRGGAPIIFSSGFNAQPSILQAHVYSNGVGTDMLAHVPEFDITKQNMTAGRFENIFTEPPISGNYYTQYELLVRGGGIVDAIDGRSADIPIVITIFAKEETQGTAQANFKSAIEALT